MNKQFTGLILILAILMAIPLQGYTATAKETVETGVNKVLNTLGDPAFNAKPEFLNPMGNIQGGFLAAMLDATMGQVVATTLHPDEVSPTLELKINFLRPAAPGHLIGRGSVVHRGNSIAFVEGKLFDSDNYLLATATATAKIIKRV